MFQTSNRSSSQAKVRRAGRRLMRNCPQAVTFLLNKCSDFGETESQPPVEAYFLATLGRRRAPSTEACSLPHGSVILPHGSVIFNDACGSKPAGEIGSAREDGEFS